MNNSHRPHLSLRAGMALVLVLCTLGKTGGAAAEGGPTLRELTLEEGVGLVLAHNLDLQVERISQQIVQRDAKVARGGYDPAFSLSAERRNEQTLGADGESGRLRSETDADSWSAGLSGNTALAGLRYELSGRLGESRGVRDSNPFDTANGRFGLVLTQPLLQGFRTDDVRYRIRLADAQSAEAALQFEARLHAVMGDLEAAWYALIQSREAIRVQEEAVRLATQLYEDNRRKVQIGTMSVLDEKQAESQAAAARADLSSARRTQVLAQNRLKALLYADHRAHRDVQIVPMGDLSDAPVAVDAEASAERAMEQRPDLQQARAALQRQGFSADYLRDQTRPSLDVIGGAGWAASAEDTYERAIDRMASADEPYWSVGVAFSVPLGNRAARNRHLQSRDTEQKMALQLRQAEEAARVEVDDAVAAVQTGIERVQATREARAYAAQALLAEQRKFESGKSTSFIVLQLQRELTSARNAEIQARADYNRQLSALSLAEGTILVRLGIKYEAPGTVNRD